MTGRHIKPTVNFAIGVGEINEIRSRDPQRSVSFWPHVNDLSPDAVVRSAHIAQGLGASSAYTWLKLPVVPHLERVMDATTLPTLLLGGDPEDAPDQTYAGWESALKLPSVRGLVVGRTMLYPADDDVAKAVDTAVSLLR